MSSYLTLFTLALSTSRGLASRMMTLAVLSLWHLRRTIEISIEKSEPRFYVGVSRSRRPLAATHPPLMCCALRSFSEAVFGLSSPRHSAQSSYLAKNNLNIPYYTKKSTPAPFGTGAIFNLRSRRLFPAERFFFANCLFLPGFAPGIRSYIAEVLFLEIFCAFPQALLNSQR